MKELTEETSRKQELLLQNTLLDKLAPVHHARYDAYHSATPCLEGTREELIKKVVDWASDPTAPSLFWLAGLAGTGKSTISKTVAISLDAKACLAGSFFFSRDLADRRRPSAIIPTLAYQMARCDPTFRREICAVLQDMPDASTRAMQIQIRSLLTGPLNKVHRGTPWVIILDALDECDKERGLEGGELLPLLARELAEFSGISIKVLITSRPASSILRLFRKPDVRQLTRSLVLHEIGLDIVRADIDLYLRHHLRRIASEDETLAIADWPPEHNLQTLVDRTGKLFVYAATAVNFLSKNPARRLPILLSGAHMRTSSPYSMLDDLYLQVLCSAVDDDDDASSSEHISKLLGTLTVLQDPLGTASLEQLLCRESGDVRDTMTLFSSLLLVPETAADPVRIFHPSLRDFLINPQRCKDPRFVVDEHQEHRHLAIHCVTLMNKKLKEAIHVNTASLSLQYACVHWGTHLILGYTDDKLGSDILILLEAFCSVGLLHWIHFLSRQGQLMAALPCLRNAEDALRNYSGGTWKTLLYDTRRLISENFKLFSVNPYHVEYSALPFAPDCPLRRQYASSTQVPSVIMLSKRAQGWDTGASYCITEHPELGSLSCIAFSRDGSQFATGCADRSIRIYDSEAGSLIAISDEIDSPETLRQLAEQDIQQVSAVDFSPDGTLVAWGSGGGTIRVWNLKTTHKTQVHRYKDRVNCLAFFPDSASMVAATRDGLMQTWSVAEHKLRVVFPLNGQQVTCVAISPDGVRVASGFEDMAIIVVWNAQDGTPLQRLEGHTAHVNSVCFSALDGRLLVSGASDDTARIWSLDMGEVALSLTVQPVPEIKCVAFSNDGGHIITVSANGCVRLWNVDDAHLIAERPHHIYHWSSRVALSANRRLLAIASDSIIQLYDDIIQGSTSTPARAHTSAVTYVAFSEKGDRIISASNDHTVMIWSTSGSILTTLHGHTRAIIAVKFSPDGMRIVSASWDRTIRIWDSESGTQLGIIDGHFDDSVRFTTSADARYIATWSVGNCIQTWSCTGQLLATYPDRHSLLLNVVVISLDGSCMIAASPICLELLNPSTGENTGCVDLDPRDTTGSEVAISPDAKYFALSLAAFADHGIRIFRARDRTVMSTLVGQSKTYVSFTTFSPRVSSRHLASGSEDGSVCLWDYITGNALAIFEGGMSLLRLRFSPDGYHILSEDWMRRKYTFDCPDSTDAELQEHPELPSKLSPRATMCILSLCHGPEYTSSRLLVEKRMKAIICAVPYDRRATYGSIWDYHGPIVAIGSSTGHVTILDCTERLRQLEELREIDVLPFIKD